MNDMYIKDGSGESASSIVDLLKLVKDKAIPVKTGVEYGNELVEINATLMENLVFIGPLYPNLLELRRI